MDEPTVGLVGTYPPTKCGIATFTASLARAIAAAEPECGFGVVASVERASRSSWSSEVVGELVRGSAASRRAVAATLRRFDVVLLQHEFGIYGGEDGREVIELVRDLFQPLIVVLHTVPRRPTVGQRRILEELALLADLVVVQSAAARTRLLEQYELDAEKVRTIPHGARANLGVRARRTGGDRRPVVLTWGLLSPDKGVEWGIEAIARLTDLSPPPRYLVVGQTHPKVAERLGEQYRSSLLDRARALGVDHLVEFDDAYHDTHSLLACVRDADIVLLPYRSREQVVSGVLVEALASGKPVVATRFPHAVELLSEGSGLLVAHEDAEAIAAALRALLTDPGLARRAAAVARRQARTLFWESVGERYLELILETIHRPAIPSPVFDHLLRLSDAVGVFEHARRTTPRRELGYCTDDVARALATIMRESRRSDELERLAATCLSFLERAQLPDGRFHNRLSVELEWRDAVGSDDATGRALWAAGVAAARATLRSQRRRARALFERGAAFDSRSPRANAYAVLGAVEVLTSAARGRSGSARALIERAASRLGVVSADARWPWPEERLTYANALLAEARIAAGSALDDERLLAEGLKLLAWLVDVETRGDHFSFTPVGGRARADRRPGFDQQPIEAAAMADACARAFDVSGDPSWRELAIRSAAWFLGVNDVGVKLLDRAGGGCRDGLEPDGVNENEGAESTLALISAFQQAQRLQAAARRADTSSRSSTTAAPTHRSAAPYVR